MLHKFAGLLVVLLLAACSNRSAALTIREDLGGDIDQYIAYWQKVARSGRHVKIDGLCASSCTLVMSYVPIDRICVTRRASMGFHLATVNGVPARRLTERLVATYPVAVQEWIKAKGGVQSLTVQDLLQMRGSDLTAVLEPCAQYQYARPSLQSMPPTSTPVS